MTNNPKHIAILYPFFVPIGIYCLKSLNRANRIALYFTLGALFIILYIT